MKSGFIIINKDSGTSSHAVVSKIKRLFGFKKAGHTGTLDPLASGVLPILVERGVKASEYMISEGKYYRATMLFGIETDTEDITGKVLSENDYYPSEPLVIDAVRSFLGEYMQTPPMYSAIKQGGKKLYELARAGIEVEREARRVEIYEIDAKKISEKEYELSVFCSGGTYIRTLITDIAKRLSAIAVMSSLHRTEAAGFSENESYRISDLEKMTSEERDGCIRPVCEIFSDYETVKLEPFFSRLARNGLEIYLKKINLSLEVGRRVKLYDENGFFAIGEVLKFDGGKAIKPLKQFDV
jgi:tRNA pseudouridine55 synthase